MQYEKRSEQRFMVSWSVQVCRINRVWTNCKAVDISATGLLFISADIYRADELLRLEITIRPTVVVKGVVRIVRTIGSSGRCSRYAAEFREFTGDGRYLLKEILVAMRRRRVNDTTQESIIPATARLAAVRRTEPNTPPAASRFARGPIIIRRGR